MAGYLTAAGFAPRLPALRLALDNPHSFGHDDDRLNVLHLSYWAPLSPSA